jgi:hypothetical protein
MSNGSIIQMLHGLRNETAVVERQPLTENVKSGSHRTIIAGAHGFRKFFDTTCTNGGMESLFVEIVIGHDIGLKRSYYKPTVSEILEGNDRMRGYISIINDLTINEENRLKTQVSTLKEELSWYADLRKDIDEMRKKLDLPPLPH